MVAGFKTPIRAGRRSGHRRALGSLTGSASRLAVTWGPYASLAAAESSGDDWVSGDTITITGGPDYIYFSSTAVDVSGVWHKYPFEDSDSPVTAELVASAPEGQDPDSWSNWEDVSLGVKATDYELDTASGRARLSELSATGLAQMATPAYLAGHTFNALRAQRVNGSASGGTTPLSLFVHANDPAANSRSCIVCNGPTVGANWHFYDLSTPVSLGLSASAEREIWIYVKGTKAAVWFADESTPRYNGASFAWTPLRNAVIGAGQSGLDRSAILNVGAICSVAFT